MKSKKKDELALTAIMQLSTCHTANDKSVEGTGKKGDVSSDETRKGFLEDGMFDHDGRHETFSHGNENSKNTSGCDVIGDGWKDSKEDSGGVDEKVKDRVLEKITSLSQESNKDLLKIDGMEDRNNRNEAEGSGGLVLSKKKGETSVFFSFRSTGRKSWMHVLMVLVLIFVQSNGSFALGQEIEVDEDGTVVDLTIENKGRHLAKCEDVKGQFYISSTDQTKGCGWVTYNTNFRCELEEVKENCRKTCGLCDDKPKAKQTKSDKPKAKQTKSESPKPSSSPVSSPSTVPSTAPSPAPSQSSAPSQCKDDEIDWVDQESNPFFNMTCSELQSEASSNQETLCNYLRVEGRNGKSAFEACCFCGGGTHVPPPCEDVAEFSLSTKDMNCIFLSLNPNLCTRLKDHDGVNGMKPQDACCACGGGRRPIYYAAVDDEEKQSNVIDQQRKRRMAEDEDIPIADINIDTSSASSTSNIKLDHVILKNVFPLPGITNVEYLGLGYDALRGNPRGSTVSELDPGFRSRIFVLDTSKPQTLSSDKQFAIPKGIEFKHTSSCTYDSVSKEISSQSDYQSSLSDEADMSSKSTQYSSTTQTISWEVSSGIQGVFPKGALGLGGEGGRTDSTTATSSSGRAFQKSEKFEAFSSSSTAESTVSYEAKALCSEYEVNMHPYNPPTLDPVFSSALSGLPSMFKEGDIATIKQYEKFIASYGTHYVGSLTLGGKRIFTTSMSSTDVAELRRESVDISSTLSVQMQEALSSSQSWKMGMSVAASGTNTDGKTTLPDLKFGELSIPSGGPIKVDVYKHDNNTPTPAEPKVKTVSGQGSYSRSEEKSSETEISSDFDSFARNKSESESAFKISQRKTKKSSVTIGGNPNLDWREWAASVKARPMPIKYDLVGIWHLMTSQQATAFVEAFLYIEGINLEINENYDFLSNGVRMTVSRGNGEAISNFSNNPNNIFREILRIDKILPASGEEQSQSVIDIKQVTSVTSNPVETLQQPTTNSFACGMEVSSYIPFENVKAVQNWPDIQVTLGSNNDELLKPIKNELTGLGAIDLKISFCDKDDWNQKTGFLPVPSGSITNFKKLGYFAEMLNNIFSFWIEPGREAGINTKRKDCSQSQFIIALKVIENGTYGIMGLKLICTDLDGSGEEEKDVFCHADKLDYRIDCDLESAWERIDLPETNSASSMNLITGASAVIGDLVDTDRSQTATSPIRERENLKVTGRKAITGFALEYKMVDTDGINLQQSLMTYSSTSQVKGNKPLALFATTIRGAEKRNAAELDDFPFIDPVKDGNVISILNRIPFGVSDDYTSPGVIAMTDFTKGQALLSDLSSFSYLSMYHEKQYEDQVVVGIVDPGGSVLNQNGLIISTNGLESGGFEVSLHTFNTNRPIVIACPHWFTGGKSRYPQNIAQLALTIGDFDPPKPGTYPQPKPNTFKVNLGIPFDRINRKHLGFSFAAFDPDFDQPGVVVGSIHKQGYRRDGKKFTVSWENLDRLTGEPISAKELKEVFGKSYVDSLQVLQQYQVSQRSTKITFNTKFSDVPSVIVTPTHDFYPPDWPACYPATWELDTIKVPHCVVEHITNSEALIKCGCLVVSTTTPIPTIAFYEMGFDFVAMGPQG